MAPAVLLNLVKRTDADPSRDWVPALVYEIVAQDRIVGTIQLRLGNTDAICRYGGHVGFCVQPDHRGHGYASAALGRLVPIARHHGLVALWITCRPDNLASRRTLENAGARYVETIDVPHESDLYARGDVVMRRYRLDVAPAA